MKNAVLLLLLSSTILFAAGLSNPTGPRLFNDDSRAVVVFGQTQDNFAPLAGLDFQRALDLIREAEFYSDSGLTDVEIYLKLRKAGWDGVGPIPQNIQFTPDFGTPDPIDDASYRPVAVSGGPCPDGKRLAEYALSFVGKLPYVWGGESLVTGADCSGFVQALFKQVGGNAFKNHRVVTQQWELGQSVPKDQLQPGDLVFFKKSGAVRFSHIGIYVGDGKFVHAPGRGQYVKVSTLSNRKDYYGAKRMLCLNSAPAQQVQLPSYSGNSCPNFNGCRASAEVSDAIFSSAKEFGFDPILICAQAAQESCYNPKAGSSAGAKGVMQLLPSTAQSACGLPASQIYDVEKNVRCGVRYLKKQLERTGDMRLALASYNAGYGNVRKYGGIPPFKETQGYVKNICDKFYKNC